jgi:hypothetical protein
MLGLEVSEASSCGIFVIQSLLSAEDRVQVVELSEAFSCGGVFITLSLLSAEGRVLGLEVPSCGGAFIILLLPGSTEERVLGLELSEAFSCGDIFVIHSGGPVDSSAMHKNGHIDHTKLQLNLK